MLKSTRSFYYITNSYSTGDIHKILYCIYISRLFLTSLFGHSISILGCLSFISILVVLRQSSIIPIHYRIIAEEDISNMDQDYRKTLLFIIRERYLHLVFYIEFSEIAESPFSHLHSYVYIPKLVLHR